MVCGVGRGGLSHGVYGGVACHMVCREGWPVTWCVGRGGLSHGV